MSGYVCAICGKTHHEVNEWRPCPLHDKKLICGTEHCIGCEHHNDDVLSSIWCRYTRKRTPEEERLRKIKLLRGSIRIISNDISRAYRANHPNKAKELEFDLMRRTAELRRIENK